MMIRYSWTLHFNTNVSEPDLFWGHRDVKMQKLLCKLCLKVLSDLEGIWYVVETCWYDKCRVHFVLSNLIQGNKNISLHSDVYGVLQTWSNYSHHWALHFDPSSNDCWLRSISQLNEEAKTYLLICLHISQSVLIKLVCCLLNSCSVCFDSSIFCLFQTVDQKKLEKAEAKIQKKQGKRTDVPKKPENGYVLVWAFSCVFLFRVVKY